MSDFNPRETIDFFLRLPEESARLTAVSLAAQIEVLNKFEITDEAFGDLAEEARMTLSTVKSALSALLAAAVKREKERL